MTIQALILQALGRNSELSLDQIDLDVYPAAPRGIGTKATTIRARVYELLRAGKIVRVRPGVYALPKKFRRRKTQAAA